MTEDRCDHLMTWMRFVSEKTWGKKRERTHGENQKQAARLSGEEARPLAVEPENTGRLSKLVVQLRGFDGVISTHSFHVFDGVLCPSRQREKNSVFQPSFKFLVW
jgi:hypothetical protein